MLPLSLKITQFLGNYSCHVDNAAHSYSVLYSLWEVMWLVTLMASLIRRTKCYKRLILFMKQNFSRLVIIGFRHVAGKPSTLVALWNRPLVLVLCYGQQKNFLMKYKLNKQYQELALLVFNFLTIGEVSETGQHLKEREFDESSFFCMLPTAWNP